MTKIQWTDVSWNPISGCDRISPGCDRCYALTLAKRLQRMGVAGYELDGDPRTSGPGFALTLHPDRIEQPLRWKRPRRVFVNSMSDLFHGDVDDLFLARVFAVMSLTEQHTYQVLTKRAKGMAGVLADTDGEFRYKVRLERQQLTRAQGFEVRAPIWPLPNVWLGVSVESQRYADLRIPHLLTTPAAVRFLSCEPLLGPINLAPFLDRVEKCATCDGSCSVPVEGGGMACPDCYDDSNGQGAHTTKLIDWVIIGGESGHGARPMDLDWARSLIEQCRSAGVAVFVKQLGSAWRGPGQRNGGPAHHDIDAWPEDLRVREYPTMKEIVHG